MSLTNIQIGWLIKVSLAGTPQIYNLSLKDKNSNKKYYTFIVIIESVALYSCASRVVVFCLYLTES